MNRHLVRIATVAALVLGWHSEAFAQTATTDTTGDSVLEQVLGGVNLAVGGNETEFGSANISSVLSNVATTQTTVINGLDDGTGATNEVFGNIDASVSTIFEKTTDNFLSDTTDGVTTSLAFQKMEGTLGAVETLTLGASLDASAAIEGGANQALNETLADGAGHGGDAGALAQTTAQEAVVATNLALNSVDLNSAVSVVATDYNLDASSISTTAIGAVGGGSIVNGKIDQLESAIHGVVGSSD